MTVPYGTTDNFNSSSRPSIHSTPPPPYAAAPPPLAPPPLAPRPRMSCSHESRERSSETTLLVNTSNRGKQAKCKSKILHYLSPLLLIVMLVSLWIVVPMVSKAVRNEMIEWERAHKQMIRDIGKLREEKLEILNEVKQLRADRDEQRRAWKLEREEQEKRRHGHVPFWGEAQLLPAQCPSERRYKARMYNLLVEDDWHKACMKESIEIAGQRFTSPNSCINEGLENGVYGYWSIKVNTRECPRTIWDKIKSIWETLKTIFHELLNNSDGPYWRSPV